ncbi:ankyrin repeat domain-containing protein [Bosea sp. (in: a-proteobacteria)]|uniref:ankyrin repeat domain-containing protein n=1 Tax=Bosea sp. (in: a-proteobacteria) TaxID=1871050 RepID=UPI002B45AD85|nr:ankyrin repeat domain-containing protein [Bosea sp. (in: a-proteobacteria)]WRH58480.1 MAG: ankyrin repeat domain-containing protein [Bosea sp. (in: a-proteobacteria)]
MPPNAALSEALCTLISERRPEIARALLLERDIDVNHRSADDVTPLMLAAEARYSYLVTVMLALGADANAVDRRGRTALMRAARENDVQAVAWLLRAGALPDMATTYQGWTALMWAARHDSTEAISALLAAGADRAPCEREGQTALSLAIRYGHASCRSLLERPTNETPP